MQIKIMLHIVWLFLFKLLPQQTVNTLDKTVVLAVGRTHANHIKACMESSTVQYQAVTAITFALYCTIHTHL